MRPFDIVVLSPALQFLVMYTIFYHREILRFLNPLTEQSNKEAWKKILAQVGSADDNHPRLVEWGRVWRIVWLVAPTGLLSLFCTFLVTSVLIASAPRLLGYSYIILAALQFIPATYFLALLSSWYLGRVPYPPRRMILPYPRLGSRIRHLAKFHD